MILRRFLALLLLVCAISLLIGVITFYLKTISPSRQVVPTPSYTVTWDSSTASFTQQDRQDILLLLQSSLSQPVSGVTPPAGYLFTIVNSQRQGNWATLNAEERMSKKTEPVFTEPLFFIAHYQSSSWSIWLVDSPQFCDQIKQLPGTLLSPDDKRVYCSP